LSGVGHSSTCPGPYQCHGRCACADIDEDNCGGCDIVCPLADWGRRCLKGRCVSEGSTCENLTDCCQAPDDEPELCQEWSCRNGGCVFTPVHCQTGANCPFSKPDCCDGSCVNRNTDRHNCATCGTECATGFVCGGRQPCCVSCGDQCPPELTAGGPTFCSELPPALAETCGCCKPVGQPCALDDHCCPGLVGDGFAVAFCHPETRVCVVA
jgi:hypothetical protein